MSKSRLVALSSMLAALSVVLLFFGSVTQVLDLSMAALASLCVVYAVIEIGGAWPWLIYGVTSLLSLLLLPDKFSACVYFVFAGYYPMVKLAIERKLPRAAEWAAKLVFFNAALTLIILASVYILHLPDDEIAFRWIVYGLANVVFVVFDFALTRLISFYFYKLKKRLGVNKH